MEQLALLLIEDSPSDARLLQEQLRDSAVGDDEVAHVTRLEAGLELLDRRHFDVVLLDLGLPDSDGLATFERVARVTPHPAVVVITGSSDSRLAEEAVRLGAQDYLVKNDATPEGLARAITYAVRRQSILNELEQARKEQLEAKDRFLSHVSHELRAPLAVIHQFVSLLTDELAGPLTAEQRDYLDITARNVDQLRVMIDDLLDIGRLEDGRLMIDCRCVNLAALVEESARSFRPAAAAKHISLVVDTGPESSAVCDETRVRQVLANLIDNALRFTPDGGRIRIRSRAADRQLHVSVADSGPGIDEQYLERVFEQFFQAPVSDEPSRLGLGLGLFVCRELISRQDGRIWAESTPGGGATVTFTLPVPAGSTDRS